MNRRRVQCRKCGEGNVLSVPDDETGWPRWQWTCPCGAEQAVVPLSSGCCGPRPPFSMTIDFSAFERPVRE